MGRAFEYRKARKLKRWGNMSRTFTRIGKEITIAVKAAGPDPQMNPRLRTLMQNAKAENMPKDTVERAIKKATDNNTRTVANVRSYFNKFGGSLGTSGSLSFLFEHKCTFRVAAKEGLDLEELELELIDYGVDEIERDEEENDIILSAPFEYNSGIQKYLEENGFEIKSTEFVRIPNDLKEVTAEQREQIEKLLEKFEDDEDVQNVFHNMKEDETEGEE